MINSHHDVALFSWQLGPADSDTPVATGYDAVVVSRERLQRVHGFFV